jgi:hypothetical protein
MIAWRYSQVLIGRGIVGHLELSEQPTFKVCRDFPRPRIFDEESSQPIVSKAENHQDALGLSLCTTQWCISQA